jgi:hypothetical protein
MSRTFLPPGFHRVEFVGLTGRLPRLLQRTRYRGVISMGEANSVPGPAGRPARSAFDLTGRCARQVLRCGGRRVLNDLRPDGQSAAAPSPTHSESPISFRGTAQFVAATTTASLLDVLCGASASAPTLGGRGVDGVRGGDVDRTAAEEGPVFCPRLTAACSGICGMREHGTPPANISAPPC